MTIVMGVLNVTPDSFSDGGRFASFEDAVDAGVAMAAAGAAWVDVGGESTRPGAQRVSLEAELERVVPVVAALADYGVAVSIDTTRAAVARACVAAGAGMVNDVSGGLADEDMLAAVADLGVQYVAMHWRAHSEHMQDFTAYDDVVTDVVQKTVPIYGEFVDRLAGEQRFDRVLPAARERARTASAAPARSRRSGSAAPAGRAAGRGAAPLRGD